MGCGNRSRVALALKAQSVFLKTVVKKVTITTPRDTAHDTAHEQDFNAAPIIYGREDISIADYQVVVASYT